MFVVDSKPYWGKRKGSTDWGDQYVDRLIKVRKEDSLEQKELRIGEATAHWLGRVTTFHGVDYRTSCAKHRLVKVDEFEYGHDSHVAIYVCTECLYVRYRWG